MINRLFYTENSFLKFVFLLLLVLVLGVLTIVSELAIPFALLYGPLLFQAHLSLKQKRANRIISFCLYFPFLLLAIWYLFLKVISTDLEEMLTNYYLVYFTLMILTLCIFPLCVLSQKRKWTAPVSYLKSVLIQQISIVYLIVSVFITFLLMERYVGLQFDVPIFNIILMLLVLCIGIVFRYVYQELTWEHQIVKKSESPKEDDSSSITYSLPSELLEDYALRLHASLEEEELYLRRDLSVELLAQETKIPRHHLSELFNAYLGKNFYQLIAEYRIRKAIELLKENGDLWTIEALAYESGFNSRSSFNKYFKEITGLLPSEFRNHELE